MKSFLSTPDMTKMPNESLAQLKNLTHQQQEELMQNFDSDTISMTKFVNAWGNMPWRNTLEKDHPSTFSILRNIYDHASKKYGIQIEDRANPMDIQRKIESAKMVKEDQTKLNTFTQALSTGYLSDLNAKIKQQIVAEKTSFTTL